MVNLDPEASVLSVFKERCRRAGGLKAGFNLRQQSIRYNVPDEEKSACDEAIASLVGKGLLVGNEPGDRYSLTEDGVAALSD